MMVGEPSSSPWLADRGAGGGGPWKLSPVRNCLLGGGLKGEERGELEREGLGCCRAWGSKEVGSSSAGT